VVGLAAGGGRVDLLAHQALELGVEVVAVARATAAQDLQLAFYAEAQARGFAAGDFAVPKILAGPEAATELAGWPCDVVLNGMTGSIGLAPTLAALAAGRTLALANKESLVAGGPLVRAALQRPDQIVPSTPSTARSPSACAAAARPRCAGWSSPPAAGPSAAASARSCRR
jgi:1-deoxy-D-xylulose-5-phosphate reductoisomerase